VGTGVDDVGVTSKDIDHNAAVCAELLADLLAELKA
jgi:hypothetical protein